MGCGGGGFVAVGVLGGDFTEFGGGWGGSFFTVVGVCLGGVSLGSCWGLLERMCRP